MSDSRVAVITDLDAFADLVAEKLAKKLRGEPERAAPEVETIKEFAARKAISEATVRRMIADGLPVERVGRRGVRIRSAVADTWIANRRHAA